MFSKIRRLVVRKRLNIDDRIVVGEGTWLRDDFRWEVREKPKDMPAIEIGDNCIIGGAFIIENESATIKIGDATTLGTGSMIVAGDATITIGNHVVMSFNVTFYNTNSHSFEISERHNDLINVLAYLRGNRDTRGINWERIVSKDIIVEDDVWIGFGATILKGVRIGRGAVVGAKSVVTHDVEPFTIVAGNPAKVVKEIKDNACN